jgi:hypothetical protein
VSNACLAVQFPRDDQSRGELDRLYGLLYGLMIVGRMVTFFVDQMVLGMGRWGQRNVWDERLGTTSVRNFNTMKIIFIKKKRIFMVLDIHSEDDVQRFE